MKDLKLKYGCNPTQSPAMVYSKTGELPFKVLNGMPGYINLLDALNSWQLVSEIKKTVGKCAAASFKHVSPAGCAIGLPVSDIEKKMYNIESIDFELSELASAYVRARGADRMSSFGDFIALSDVCDKQTALVIKKEVSDGIIAPGYDDDAYEILSSKKGGKYTILQIDPNYTPPLTEERDIFGATFSQGRNEALIDADSLSNVVTKAKELTDEAKRDLIIAQIILKYTQSNSVCYVKNGMAIGIGAGQQSRIHCTRLAGDKADNWHLRMHPKVLSLDFKDKTPRPTKDNVIDVYLGRTPEDVLGDDVWESYFNTRPEPLSNDEKREWLNKQSEVCLASDAFFPFSDNIERAYKSGVKYIAQPGGSVRDEDVINACDKYGIFMCHTGLRLFHH